MRKTRMNLSLNTIQKKCMAAIIGVGIGMIIMTSLSLPNIFYYILKPYMINNLTLAVESTATKISYILHQNTQYHLKFYKNEELIKLIGQYESSNEQEKLKLREEIGSFFPTQSWGGYEPGSIKYQQDMGLILDGKEGFAKEEIKTEFDMVIHSDWYQRYCNEMKNFGMVYSNGNPEVPRFYSPVFKMIKDGKEIQFIAYGLRWKAARRTYDTVMIEDVGCFKSILSGLQEIHNADVALIGRNQELLYAIREDSFFKEIPKDYPQKVFEGNQYELKRYERNDKTDLVMLTSYRIEGLKFAIHITKEEIIAPWKEIILIVQLIFLALIIIILVIVSVVLNRNLKNLKRLSSQMKQVQQGFYDGIAEIQTNDEIGRLSKTFCKMIGKIGDYIKEIVQHEEREKQIQYSLLVSQIDPHFIYNTLNTITYLAKLNRVDDIMKMNGALIITLKDRLKMKQYRSFDTIENEKIVLEHYMLIQNYLCNNSIQFDFIFEAKYRELEIPKNVLQPFVENSILHGLLLHKDEKGNLLDGEIQIVIVKEEKGLRISIKDNGVGMSTEDLEKYFCKEARADMFKNTKEAHIGIYNIRMRLNYLYQNNYKMNAFSKECGGVTIELYLPDRDNETPS